VSEKLIKNAFHSHNGGHFHSATHRPPKCHYVHTNY